MTIKTNKNVYVLTERDEAMGTQAEATYLRPGLRLVGILVSRNLSDGSVQPTPVSSAGKNLGVRMVGSGP